MRRLTVPLITVIVVLHACAAPVGDEQGGEADALAAIERLHAADREAVLARDGAALLALWSEDPIALPPDGPNLVGRAAIDSLLTAMSATPDSARAWRAIDYVQTFSEVVVLEGGEWAWDLGTARTVLEHRATGRRVAADVKLLRILRRTPTGEWKVHRSMWSDPTQNEIDASGPDSADQPRDSGRAGG
jgi:ketosteroid isomerase-like protein